MQPTESGPGQPQGHPLPPPPASQEGASSSGAAAHATSPLPSPASSPRRYRKKPVEIEAIQWTGSNLDELRAFVPEEHRHNKVCEPMGIRTLEGVMTISTGDFIVRGVKGEFYPIKPDIFAATYDDVPSPTPYPHNIQDKGRVYQIEAYPDTPAASLDIRTLSRGDIIRHKSGSESYVVTASFGNRATAVATVDITNPSEWELVRKADYGVVAEPAACERIRKSAADIVRAADKAAATGPGPCSEAVTNLPDWAGLRNTPASPPWHPTVGSRVLVRVPNLEPYYGTVEHGPDDEDFFTIRPDGKVYTAYVPRSRLEACTELIPREASTPTPESPAPLPQWRQDLLARGIALTEEEAELEGRMRADDIHCVFYPSSKKRHDALAAATVKVLREAGEKAMQEEGQKPSLLPIARALVDRVVGSAACAFRDHDGGRIDDRTVWDNFARCVLSPNADAAMLRYHASHVVHLVEGPHAPRWLAGGLRLKDTREWCAFYCAVKAAERGGVS